MADPRTNTAIGAGDDVFPAHDFRVAHEPIGDGARMLDEIAAMTDDTGDEHLIFGKLDLFPHAPLVVMARVGSLDGIRPSAHF